jgi:hypothetical protein
MRLTTWRVEASRTRVRSARIGRPLAVAVGLAGRARRWRASLMWLGKGFGQWIPFGGNVQAIGVTPFAGS